MASSWCSGTGVEDLQRLNSMPDFKRKAKEIIEKEGWIFYNHSSGRKWTYHDSFGAFDRYIIRPRVMRDVTHRSLATTILGHPVSMPICIAPTAFHIYAHPNAEKDSAKGAKDAGTLMVLSCAASTTIADVASAAPEGLRWMQTYIFKNRKHTEHIVSQAERAGFKAIVLTVDSPVTLNFNELQNDVRAHTPKYYNLTYNPNYRAKNLDIDLPEVHAAKAAGDSNLVLRYIPEQQNSPITWDDFKWLKSITSLPIVCKGILTGEVAREAVDAGAAGIIVSTHGGRQLDGAPASMDALSEVVEAVQGTNVEVYLDGGARSGSDIFKALGKGARAVFIGRPILWGLACGGAAGVQRVLNVLGNEVNDVMALSGCCSPQSIPPDMIVHQSYYGERERIRRNSRLCPKCKCKL